MAPTITIPKPPTSPRSPETPSGSPARTPPDSPQMHISLQVKAIHHFEQDVVKFTQALKKMNAADKHGNDEPEVKKQVEAKQRKTRASKMEYKLVDEVYVTYSVATTLLTYAVQLR